MINSVTLLGYLGRDAELRTTPSRQPVANFSMATTRGWKDSEGERQEQTEWHQVVAWGKLAEIAGQYLTKGKLVAVEGRLQTRSWEDKTSGEKRYRTEVVAESFQMVSTGRNGEQDAPPAEGPEGATAEPAGEVQA